MSQPAPRRRDLMTRTALCGALLGLAFASPALALPVLGGTPLVNAGGGLPTITGAPNETDVALHAPRTVIDWTTYNVAAGEKVSYTFDARNWIVLNRINDTKVPEVDGVVEGRVNGAYGGNVWFAAKNGMIFGNGAQIDAGGILVSAAAPDIPSFLDPTNTTFTFPGTELIDVPVVGMTTGSSITGHGGLVALIAPEVVTQAGTSVTGLNGSSVLYGATGGYIMRLAQNAPGDFDLVDFVIPSTSSGSLSSVLLDLQNATSANSVFVAAVSSNSASSAVINLEGMVTATAATADGGDIILSGGGNITGRQVGAPVGGTPTDIYLRTATATRDLQVGTIGHIFGQPYNRPPPPPPITAPVPSPECGFSCDTGDGTSGFGSNCSPFCETTGGGPFTGLASPGGPESLTTTRASATDPTQVSVLSAGRDLILNASETIALGSATATRDFASDGAAFQANSLTIGRNTTVKTESGTLDVGLLTLSGPATLASAGAVEIDNANISGGAGSTLNVTAAGDLAFGDGTGAASGGDIVLTAGGAVNLNLASAMIDTVTAGGTANLQAGTLKVNKVSGAQVLVGGGTVTVGQATGAGDIYVAATGDASLGSGVAGDDIYVLSSSGTASLISANLTGTGADTVGVSFAGNPDAAGNGRVVSVLSTTGSAYLGEGSGTVAGATAVNVIAGQDALVQLPTALPTALTVTAGRDATLSGPTVAFDAVTAGRDVTLMNTVGDFTSTGPLIATRNLTIGSAGALTVGNITATSGSIALTGTSVTAGALTAGQDLTLQASNGGVRIASYSVGRDLTLQGSSLSLGQQLAPIGRDLSITTPGDFTAPSGLTAGRNVTLDVGGTANIQGLSVPGTVDVIANDIALSGTLAAANVQIESASGALRVGGSAADGAPAAGMWLDNAEFSRIRATGTVKLYAGLAAGGPQGDLTVLQLDVNPANTPSVSLLAGGGHDVLAQAPLAPTVSGGTLQIGDTSDTTWQPTQILVSGTLGSAAYTGGGYSNIRAFDHVKLFATQDIILGSQRFINLIEQAPLSAISIGKNQPTGVIAVGAEQNMVLVAAGDLEVSSQREVVAQNTASRPDISVGLLLTGASRPNLIIDPPQLVDVYGAFVSPSGGVVSSFAAGSGVAYTVVDSGGNPASPPSGSVYRFNSCAVGTNDCLAAASAADNLQQQMPALSVSTDTGPDADSDSRAAAGRAGQRAVTPPLLAAGPTDPDAALAEPVTAGAGSEEIWRSRAQPAQPTAKPGARP